MSYQAPPPSTGYPAQAAQKQQQAYPVYVAPPPAGYPTRDGGAYPEKQYPTGAGGDTRSRGHHGDGFWKGCCAALCCCCLLDMCF